MKLSVILLMSILMSYVYAGTPVWKMVPIDGVFSPLGFDSNDNSEIIVSGLLPNFCHKSPKAEVVVKGNLINIKVTALYYAASNPFCPTSMPSMAVPFVESVDVGVLNKGKYKIIVNGKTPWTMNSEIQIAESRSDAARDDYIYANVSYIEQEEGSNFITLKGYNPYDCLVIDEVEFISNEINAYSILPKMKKLRDFCPMKLVPFSHTVEVPQTLKNRKILLHVRSMDGNSVNSLFIKSN